MSLVRRLRFNYIQYCFFSGQKILRVDFPPTGGDRWVVVTTDGYYTARNIPQAAFDQMQADTARGYRVTQVPFTPASQGGYVVLAF